MALLIDATMHEALLQGRPAARALAAMGVPFEVAMRVLTRPEERRHPLPPADYKRGS